MILIIQKQNLTGENSTAKLKLKRIHFHFNDLKPLCFGSTGKEF